MTPQEQAFWERVLDLAVEQFSPKTYEFFILDGKLLGVQNELAHIQLPEVKQLFWKQNTADIILTAGFEIFGRELKAQYHTDQEGDEEFLDQDVKPIMVAESRPSFVDSSLNGKYTFDNFIQGEGNRWPLGAALAVAEQPGSTYNPLFIWGGPGLGKTHLLNAIGNEVLNQNPSARVKYITTEEFVNEYVNSTRLNKMEELKQEFRHLDVLLIDDIQYLANKTGTQEEFFNTFNALHSNGKQIVLTSDRAPAQLDGLEQRLVTRFGWGLTTDITPPDYETRVAILLEKTQDFSYKFKPEAIEYLANQFDSNVRELEGALKNINLIATVNKVDEIGIDLIAQALRAIKSETSTETSVRVIPIEQIQEEVSRFYGLTTKDLKGPKRVQNIAFARQVAMYLIRTLTDYSLPKIGDEFGGRDHSTVLHSYNKIKAALEDDMALRTEIETITQKLK